MNKQPTVLFEKTYGGESIYDAYRDFSEALTEDYNPLLKDVPIDGHGFPQGQFTVRIEWVNSHDD